MTRSETPGNRKHAEGDELWLAPGEYGIDPDSGEWLARPPGGDLHAGTLAAHDVTEHGDGTITVSPSILVTEDAPVSPIKWHGYLRRGVWIEV